MVGGREGKGREREDEVPPGCRSVGLEDVGFSMSVGFGRVWALLGRMRE
jgi:hypothetical protein